MCIFIGYNHLQNELTMKQCPSCFNRQMVGMASLQLLICCLLVTNLRWWLCHCDESFFLSIPMKKIDKKMFSQKNIAVIWDVYFVISRTIQTSYTDLLIFQFVQFQELFLRIHIHIEFPVLIFCFLNSNIQMLLKSSWVQIYSSLWKPAALCSSLVRY